MWKTKLELGEATYFRAGGTPETLLVDITVLEGDIFDKGSRTAEANPTRNSLIAGRLCTRSVHTASLSDDSVWKQIVIMSTLMGSRRTSDIYGNQLPAWFKTSTTTNINGFVEKRISERALANRAIDKQSAEYTALFLIFGHLSVQYSYEQLIVRIHLPSSHCLLWPKLSCHQPGVVGKDFFHFLGMFWFISYPSLSISVSSYLHLYLYFLSEGAQSVGPEWLSYGR